MIYFVNYHTGAGNFKVEGTLDQVKKMADLGISYTQQDVSIEYDGKEVARRKWYGVTPTKEDEKLDIISYDSFGFYDIWK